MKQMATLGVQWTGENYPEIDLFAKSAHVVLIENLDGVRQLVVIQDKVTHVLDVGDWLVREADGYAVREDVVVLGDVSLN